MWPLRTNNQNKPQSWRPIFTNSVSGSREATSVGRKRSCQPERGLRGDSRYQRSQRKREGSNREASSRNKPRRPLPPSPLRGHLAVLETCNRYFRAGRRHSRNVLTRRGSPPSLQGTPTPRCASAREPRLHHPGGKGADGTKRSTPPPRCRHAAREGGKHPHSTPFASGKGPRRGWGPGPGGEGAAAQPRPPRRSAQG